MSSLEIICKQNKNFAYKLFISYIVFTILLIVSITIVHLYFSKEQKNIKFKREASLQAEEKKKIFENFFQGKKHSVKALSKNPYFSEFAKNGTEKYFTEVMFYTIMEESREYMQMRYLDSNGNEKIRYDRDGFGKSPYKIDKLQKKANRYYFKESLALNEGNTWISSIDLNIEYEKIQIPFVPVVRIATPLFNQKEFQGVFVVNLFIDELLKRITSSLVFDIFLVDRYGNFIVHKDPKYNWSKYKKEKFTLEDEFGKRASLLILSAFKKTEIYMNKFLVQPLDLDNQKLYLVMVEKDSSIKEMEETNNFMIIVIILFAIIMSIPFSIFFSKPLSSMYEIVLSQRSELKKLADNLEKRIQIESIKNAKKDRILMHQSKLAELGDMIGNIAHQWRHPLTRLSLLIQNLKAYKNKDKLTDEILDESIKSSLHQIDFMSNTIDNFKDFYRKDKEKTKFYISDCYHNVLNIVGAILEHSNISLEIYNEENLKIYGNKNEFSQVLMNLIINSKEALVENNIINPYIKIFVSKENEQTKIEVRDNAGGIPSAVIDNIFKPYFTTKDNSGTGIGLYLSKVIIEDEMKGKISVSNYNGGVSFTIIV